MTILKELLKLKEEVETKQAELKKLEKTKARLKEELARLKRQREER